MNSGHALELMAKLFVLKGVPDHVRSGNGSEMTAAAVRERLGKVGVKTLCIEPGSPWENGYRESFDGKFGDELLKREVFYSLKEVQAFSEQWRREYNTVRPRRIARLPAAGARTGHDAARGAGSINMITDTASGGCSRADP